MTVLVYGQIHRFMDNDFQVQYRKEHIFNVSAICVKITVKRAQYIVGTM